ncbi:UDP-glucose dehydrogenase family protein [Nocardioides iriomotensis]|uniref:UDP-glucose 6-dehydrogenase n=1 Tax=Nocardioides iriomotensis TaxID=715784 RepID=A0A4Q5J782_9ACTN|nr:UDP-glucose/GDP-mannose dehydrogenase family protein [Nocardioides iriomotensis]RYU14510.1 UDP-glucose/GDP-mannose dehydrogenase family protein [Nocardioides iriomotensis]
MRVTVIGCGYLGATHAAGMAELGYEVLGLEVDPAKVDQLSAGRVPFYEPDLEELLSRHVTSGNLRFTTSFEEAGAFGDVHFLCVGTPQQAHGLGADLSQVEGAVVAIAPYLRGDALVVGKSTVPVGTAERLLAMLDEHKAEGATPRLAWNPEFLREGFAVKDTLAPDRLVFGVTEPSAEATLREVYAKVLADDTPCVVTDLPTAELVKVSANAFLATKISFINAIAEMCEATGADVWDLAEAIGHDARIGRKFLNAGIGFGGGCLPKDIRAFQHRAGELGVDHLTSLMREVDAINLHRRERVGQIAAEMLGELSGARVAVLGAAFKPDSDDVRDSPALAVAGTLHLAGADVSVYDPKANANAAKRFPTLTYEDSVLDACRDADLVLHLTEWPEFRSLTPGDLDGVVRRKQILDGRNLLDADAWRDGGWTFRSMGRR